jgi:hypothetical protein
VLLYKEIIMCTNEPQIAIDIDTLAREFHEIKHLLSDLNTSVAAIAHSLKSIEQRHSQEIHQFAGN